MNAIQALQPAIVFLGAGVAAALAARAVRLSPIVGYLLVGVVIGPHALHAVSENETTHFLAELGVVFLLFDIGLHFSVKELRDSRADMLGLAPAQMLLSGAAFSVIAYLIGCPAPVAIAVGLSLALSSTAVVTRVLTDRNNPGCPVGRSAIAVLIAQDIVAIFLLAFAASLKGDPAALPLELVRAAAYSLIAFAIALTLGRFVIRPVFAILAATRNEEIFTALALLIVLTAGAATGALGLSLTLGAFLAGMAIADTPYRQIIQAEIKPFRGLLLGLFFMSVGMKIDVPSLLPAWPLVLLTTIGLVAIKTALTYLAARMNGRPSHAAAQLSFLLSQGSEFTLVVTGVVAISIPSQWTAVLIAAVALSLMIAPLWAALGQTIARHIVLRQHEGAAPSMIQTDTGDRPVLVYGMTAEGRLAVDALRDMHIPYVALDLDADRFVNAASDGYDVIFGDSADLRLLDRVGAPRARAFVLGSPRYEISLSITPTVRTRYPEILRFVAVHDEQDKQRHEALGMFAHMTLAEPRGIELATDLLARLDVAPERIAEWVRHQAELRGVLQPTMETDDNVDTEAA